MEGERDEAADGEAQDSEPKQRNFGTTKNAENAKAKRGGDARNGS